MDHIEEKIHDEFHQEEDVGEEEELDCTEVDAASNQAVLDAMSKAVHHVERHQDVINLSEERMEDKNLKKALPKRKKIMSNNKNEVSLVVLKKKMQKNIQCQEPGCAKTFSRSNQIKDHMRNDHGHPKLQCPIAGCSKESTYQQNIKRHVKKIHKITDKTASDMELMEVNCTDKELNKKFKCTICGVGFPFKAALNMHLTKRHQQIVKKRKNSSISCKEPGCQKIYTTKGGLKGHMRAEHDHPKLRCPIVGCGVESAWHGHMIRHVKEAHKR